MSWKTRIDIALGRRPAQSVKLEHDCERLNVIIDDVRTGLQTTSMQWKDVQRVVAFKRDLIFCDMIVMRFIAADNAIEINEEAEGWEGLLQALPSCLPGALSTQAVFDAVALPAFATNATDVYNRNS
jgi:hypothetical protein